MPSNEPRYFFVDPSRCIGCNACVQACTECDSHKGYSMIQLDYIDRSSSTQTVPVVCMHCDSPTCAEVCPAHAIKRTGDGVVQSARKPRGIACNNCVLACPFGIPKMNTRMELMMKCDQCYDRTSKLFEYPNPGNHCILVRLTETNFVAYGQKCTHLSCPVLPRPDLGHTVATFVFANATGMKFLLIIPQVSVYIAMLAWVLTFSGMIYKLATFWLLNSVRARARS